MSCTCVFMHPPGRSSTSASVWAFVARSEHHRASVNEETGRASFIWAIMRALQSLHRDPETSALSGLILIRPKNCQSQMWYKKKPRRCYTLLCVLSSNLCAFFFYPYITTSLRVARALWSIVRLLLEQPAFGLPGAAVTMSRWSQLIQNS